MTNMQELELESELELPELGELEGELEWSHETEFESEAEAEAEAFFGQLASLAKKAIQSPALRRIAATAARSALQSLMGQGEGEFEGEGELESELNPIRKVYPDALLEHMAHAAAEAESEFEAAEAFAPLVPVVASKLAPMVARGVRAVAVHPAAAAPHGRPGGHAPRGAMAPRVMANVMRVAPQLTRGVSHVARTLYRNPQMRPLVRVIPAIARQTTASLARQVAHGRPITPRMAVRTLARQTAHVLGSPARAVHAYRHSRALDKHHHRIHRSGPRYYGRYGQPVSYGYWPQQYRRGSSYGPAYGPAPVAPGYAAPAAPGYAPAPAYGRPRHDLHPGYVCYPRQRAHACASCGR